MAWEWSHTPEAYYNAQQNLGSLSEEEVEIIFAEWAAYEGTDDEAMESAFDEGKYEDALHKAQTELHYDVLVDAIWDKASELRTCTNGGWRAWVCPYGCHTVSFDKEENDG